MSGNGQPSLSRIAKAVEAYYAKNSKLPPAALLTPSESCCKQEGGTCQPVAATWDGPGWQAIDYRPEAAHRYQYAVELPEPSADGRQTVSVRAIGDLDCDGEFSTFETYGEVDSGSIKFSGNVYRENPYE